MFHPSSFILHTSLCLLALAQVSCTTLPPAAPPRHAAAHVLRNRELCVEVMDPNAPERYNRGVRFSSVANVLRVTADGKDYLFSPVAHDPMFENAGLATEFDLTTPGGPPGFSEAAMGTGFVKIGVGVLRKHRPDYFFWPQYELLQPAVTQVVWYPARAVFDQSCKGINGYAYRLQADVKLKGRSLAITYCLTNTGAKPFHTEQYAHNFFTLDGQPVGPCYVLAFPGDFLADKLEPEQVQIGREIRFEKEMPKAANIAIKPQPAGASAPAAATLAHTGNGMQIRAAVSVPVSKVALHASKTYVCPEQFVAVDLKPGGSTSWTRTYEFTCSPPR